jgi:hypothetical protein
MIVDYVWRFLPTGKAKHALRKEGLEGYPNESAVCGRMALAFLPVGARWQKDPEMLNKLPECLSCRRILDTI